MDFNLESYRQLLAYAKDLGSGFELEEFIKLILLRHDLDLCFRRVCKWPSLSPKVMSGIVST
jgi:hypothetical protein